MPEPDVRGLAAIPHDDVRAVIAAYRSVLESADDPDTMLRRMIDVAMQLTGAEYGAIGVTGADGDLDQFVHVGIDGAAATRIGHAPKGLGLLGALIDEQRPILLADLTADPRSSGFPPHHPGMRSFLGAPIRVRGGAYANFYLTHGLPGRFDETHLEALVALSGTVALVIDFARVTRANRIRQAWNQAILDVTGALLTGDDGEALGIVAEHVLTLADADGVSVVTPAGEDHFVIDLARGDDADRAEGTVLPRDGHIGQVFASGQPKATQLAGLADAEGWDAAAIVPLAAAGRPVGVLLAARHAGKPQFSAAELDLIADFAGQASIALVLVDARDAQQRLAVLEDRSRIARDLHDHVIQRIFAAGLSLQAAAGRVDDEDARRAILDQIGSLDQAIAEIRTAIFAMTSADERPSLRHRVIDEVGAAARALPAPPALSFAGAIDLLVPEALGDDVLAVVREGLANVVKHAAGARAVAVTVAAADDDVTVTVEDDGCGVPARPPRRSGVGNLADRAESWGGSLVLAPRAGGGTRMVWTASYTRSGGDG